MTTLHALDEKKEELYTLIDGEYQVVRSIPARMIAKKFNEEFGSKVNPGDTFEIDLNFKTSIDIKFI